MRAARIGAPPRRGTMSTSRAFALTLLLVVVAQCVVYGPRLPDVVASHFDSAGRPNGWMSRTTFLLVYAVMMTLLTLVFSFLPRNVMRLPRSTVNLPHREFWLAPERRAQAMAMLQERMLWFGNATMLFMIAVFQMAIEANLDHPPRLSSAVFWVLIVYFVITAAWLIEFLWAFGHKRPPRDSSTA